MARRTDEQFVEFALDQIIGICGAGLERVRPLKKEGSMKIRPSYLRGSSVAPDASRNEIKASKLAAVVRCLAGE